MTWTPCWHKGHTWGPTPAAWARSQTPTAGPRPPNDHVRRDRAPDPLHLLASNATTAPTTKPNRDLFDALHDEWVNQRAAQAIKAMRNSALGSVANAGTADHHRRVAHTIVNPRKPPCLNLRRDVISESDRRHIAKERAAERFGLSGDWLVDHLGVDLGPVLRRCSGLAAVATASRSCRGATGLRR